MTAKTPQDRPRPPDGKPPRQSGGGGRSLAHILSRTFFYGAITCIVLLVGGFVVFMRTLESYRTDTGAVADGIVVLTGGSQRIAEAAELLAQGRARRMLITGVNEITTREEIAATNPVIARTDCCVDLDYRARNTIGNAIETRRWLESNRFRSLIVVTSVYHMPRTLLELRHALPGITLLPYPVTAAPHEPERWLQDSESFRMLVREYVKYLVAFTRTTMEDDPEDSPFAVIFGGREPLS